jgi:hypothetical protein
LTGASEERETWAAEFLRTASLGNEGHGRETSAVLRFKVQFRDRESDPEVDLVKMRSDQAGSKYLNQT